MIRYDKRAQARSSLSSLRHTPRPKLGDVRATIRGSSDETLYSSKNRRRAASIIHLPTTDNPLVGYIDGNGLSAEAVLRTERLCGIETQTQTGTLQRVCTPLLMCRIVREATFVKLALSESPGSYKVRFIGSSPSHGINLDLRIVACSSLQTMAHMNLHRRNRRLKIDDDLTVWIE